MTNHNTGGHQPSPIVEQLQARVAHLEARLVKRSEELRDVETERARFERLFATTCETLGAIQEALGNGDTPELTGFEPQLVKKLVQERDALAAHVERLSVWIKEHGQHADTCDLLDLDEEGLHKACSCGLDAVYEAPATSLARLKAQWQAEALEQCAKGVAACKPGATPRGISIAIKMEANDLRRQAEGDKS